MHTISIFQGSHKNTFDNGLTSSYKSFKELSNQFRTVRIGSKETCFFTRGPCKGGQRKDSNISKSTLLIFNVDSSNNDLPAPEPINVHAQLCELGFNHFIYTTHSHSTIDPKYRIVIECEEHIREQHNDNMIMMLNMLESHIDYKKEDYAWSQAFYLPYREKDDGQFEYYEYFDGQVVKNNKHRREYETFEITLPDSAKEHGNIYMPDAPGRLGRLVYEAFHYMRYPDERIAMVTALFTVASVVGRKFNVDFADKEGLSDPTGLNLYLTLIGSTGVGKDQMKSFAEKMLYSTMGDNPDKINTFLSGGDFTSTRAIYNQIKFARSQGVILGEAGVNMQSSSGDKNSVKQFLLSCYGRSHHNAFTDPKTYSDADNSVKPLRAVALTKLSESTESELFKGYMSTNAMESGLVPRESVFRVTNPCVKLNRNKKRRIETEHLQRFSELVELASEVQQCDDPKSIIISCEHDQDLCEEIYDFGDRMRAAMFDNSLDRIEQVMASRMLVKALRFAGIAAVYNANKPSDYIIKKEHWYFGKAMVEYEMATVKGCFSDYQNADIDSISLSLAIEIAKVVMGRGSKEYGMNKTLLANKAVQESKLKKIFTRFKVYKEYLAHITANGTKLMNRDHFRDVLNHLKDQRVIYLSTMDIGTNRKSMVRCVIVNESINEFIN